MAKHGSANGFASDVGLGVARGGGKWYLKSRPLEKEKGESAIADRRFAISDGGVFSPNLCQSAESVVKRKGSERSAIADWRYQISDGGFFSYHLWQSALSVLYPPKIKVNLFHQLNLWSWYVVKRKGSERSAIADWRFAISDGGFCI